MKFQYTLLFLSALVLVIPSGYGLECYNQDCEDFNYSCPEVGNQSELTKETCANLYPDRTPVCIKSVQYQYPSRDNTHELNNRRIIAVYRRCAYALSTNILTGCEEGQVYGRYQTKECAYANNLSNF